LPRVFVFCCKSLPHEFNKKPTLTICELVNLTEVKANTISILEKRYNIFDALKGGTLILLPEEDVDQSVFPKEDIIPNLFAGTTINVKTLQYVVTIRF